MLAAKVPGVAQARLCRAVQAETEHGPIRLTLKYLTTLGHGRGARVDLVHEWRGDRLIAEKVFGLGRGLSAWLANLLGPARGR